MADAAAPSVPGTPTFERVPAAEGSLLRGWLAVAYPFRNAEKARRTIAAWAGATTNARIVWSLVATFVIDACSGALGSMLSVSKGQLSVHTPGMVAIGSGANGALLHLTEFFAITLTTTTLLASLRRYGSFRRRFGRLLRPWALVQPIIAVTGMLLAQISSPALAHVGDINTPIWATPLTFPQTS